MTGNQVDCTCTITRWPGRNVWSTVGRPNLYSSGVLGVIAFQKAHQLVPANGQVTAAVVTALEESGPSYGVLKDAYVPGLLLGISGVVYQLLRADPASRLPSFLVLEGLVGAHQTGGREAHAR